MNTRLPINTNRNSSPEKINRITWSEDDTEYVGLCTEFPGLSWLAATPEAALKGVRKMVADIVQDIKKILLIVLILSKKSRRRRLSSNRKL